MKKLEYTKAHNLIIVFSFILLFSCNTSHTKVNKNEIDSKSNMDGVDLTEESETEKIAKLSPKNCVYANHFICERNDTKDEMLVLISETDEKSDCVSMWDTSCYYCNISLFQRISDGWNLINEFKIPDFENATIEIDSISNLVIEYRLEPSGLSKERRTEVYQYLNETFKMIAIKLAVSTKIGTAYSTNCDTWDYFLDFASNELKIIQSEVRMVKSDNDETNIIATDSVIHRKIEEKYVIQLGEEYNLDSIIGKANLIHYY